MSVFIVAFLLVILVCIYQVSLRVRVSKTRQKNGFILLKSLRIFLSDLQKHRGLTTGVIQGDLSKLAAVGNLEAKISKEIKTVTAIDAWIQESPEWLDIREHWSRVVSGYSELTVERNLQQHGSLIRNVLYLIAEMAEEHELLRVASLNASGYDFLWKGLLNAAEYMGQARALGMSITTSNQCGSVDRIRLHYLSEKIADAAQDLSRVLKVQGSRNRDVNRLLDCMERQLDVSPITLSPSEYFDLATSAIDSVYAVFDERLAQIETQA